jgi:hypothetical protein
VANAEIQWQYAAFAKEAKVRKVEKVAKRPPRFPSAVIAASNKNFLISSIEVRNV